MCERSGEGWYLGDGLITRLYLLKTVKRISGVEQEREIELEIETEI